MPNEIKNQLQKLQKEKTELFLKIQEQKNNEKNPNLTILQRMTEIQNEMANLNKLDDKEKNIHAIWIGIPPKGEFDNLKVWAKYNQEYKIHIWTDFTHILTYKLNNIISENSKIPDTNETTHDYEIEAKLKDDFYNNYQLKNLEKTFDENAKHFLLDNEYANKNEVINWIKDGKEKLIQEIEEIKKYTPNEVILHDINQENDIFPTEKYKEGYLNTLEHLHICACASDRLRYAILNKFGGVYLDTDIMPKFNLDNIKKDEKINTLINSIDGNESDEIDDKIKLITNQMFILANLNQLNDEKLKDFANNWENISEGKTNQNLEIFKEIAQQFKNLNLKLEPEMKLSEFPINNILQIGCYIEEHYVSNAFIISKKNSILLQKIMIKIEITDQNLKRNKDMDTYTKLINKNNMIIYHTGPGILDFTIQENDITSYYKLKAISSKIISFDNINSLNSSWFNQKTPENAIKDESMLATLFWNINIKREINDYDDFNEK